jgi:hypothetical protein
MIPRSITAVAIFHALNCRFRLSTSSHARLNLSKSDSTLLSEDAKGDPDSELPDGADDAVRYCSGATSPPTVGRRR